MTADPDDMLSEHDPSDADPAAQCPQEHYRQLRAQGAVVRVDGLATLLGRHEVEKALRMPQVFSSNMAAVTLGNMRPLIPLQIDPPEHAAYRRLLDPLFMLKSVERLEPAITARATELIDAVIDQGECDFSSAFAVPLPTSVFADLLGLAPVHRPALRSIVRAILRPSGNGNHRVVAENAGRQSYELFTQALDERTRDPRNDLLSHLLQAEVDGRSLTRGEMLDICYLLLLGGMDTTSNALGCTFAFLAAHPDHRRQIVAEPDIVPAAVEEMLRWESPTTAVRRYLVQDVDIGGCRLAAGQRIDAALASANTDEAYIFDAFTVDFHRRPNNHLAFGTGVHRCLGAQLARLELRIALREWHRRIPEYGLAPGARPHYALGGTLRYVEQLSLTWPPTIGRMP